MEGKKFATAINCIDGRVQYPVLKWLIEENTIDYVDMITEPGPDKALIEGSPELINGIQSKINISLENHHSNLIVVVGHYDCAANCVCKEEHYTQIKKCAEIIRSWYSSTPVIGLYVNDHWQVEQVCQLNNIQVA